MGKLSAAARKALPDSKFGLPESRKYPLSDRNHDVNAKARAAQQEKKGRLSAAEEARIDAAANRALGKGKK